MFSFDDSCRKLGDLPVTISVMSMNSTLQQCPPWTLHAWPTLLWQVGKQIPLQMHHLGTQIINPGDAMFRTVGQTIWAWHGEEGDVGLAWDWVQLTRGVVAMADPMAVVTNLRLVGHEGEALTAFESARHINCIVHGLPWQHEVERALCGTVCVAAPSPANQAAFGMLAAPAASVTASLLQ
jgi:hypothetical protein